MALDPDYASELFQELGPVRCRRMFGGTGVYHDGLMFALEAQGVLYLKTDAESQAVFRDEGTEPFSYATSDGQRTLTSYWRIPERLFDEPDELAVWARRAVGIAAAKAKDKAPKARPAKAGSPKGGSAKPKRGGGAGA